MEIFSLVKTSKKILKLNSQILRFRNEIHCRESLFCFTVLILVVVVRMVEVMRTHMLKTEVEVSVSP